MIHAEQYERAQLDVGLARDAEVDEHEAREAAIARAVERFEADNPRHPMFRQSEAEILQGSIERIRELGRLDTQMKLLRFGQVV